MNFAVTLLLFLYAVLAVLLTTRHFGRLAGFSTAAACGASLAFFAMPPAFSFVVENPLDQGTLLVYSMASLVLVHRAPRIGGGPPSLPRTGRSLAFEPVGTLLVDAIAEALMSTSRRGIETNVPDTLTIARSPAETRTLILAILDSACSQISPICITAYGGRTPGTERIWIAIQHRQWPVEPRTLTIGQHLDSCVRLNGMVTWFDNGFELIYQISIPAKQASGPRFSR